MKRLVLGLAVVVALSGVSVSSAQASSLTVKSAKAAAVEHGANSRSFNYPWIYKVGNCSRMATDRVRCSVSFFFETYWRLKDCKSRVEVASEAEIRARTIGTKCRTMKQPFLSLARAEDAAYNAMDPNARKYARGGTSSSYGRNRHQIEVSWEYENQACSQTARIRLLDGKVLVNVSEVSCVTIPEWPKRSKS